MSAYRIDGDGALAGAVRAAVADAGWREGGGDALFLAPPASDGVDAIVARVRAAIRAVPDVVVVLLGSDAPELTRAAFAGALGPLAIEAAPAVRIATVALAAGGDLRDAAAAALFLATAGSTTGQLLTVGSLAGASATA